MDATTQVTAEQITDLHHELAEAIRAYCRNQVEIWREVPYWAHKANGRTGWSSLTSLASQGYYDIFGEGRGFFVIAVDCATGEIVCNQKPTRDEQVVKIGSQIDLIYATEVVGRFMREAQVPPREHTYPRNEEELALEQGPPPPRPFVRN